MQRGQNFCPNCGFNLRERTDAAAPISYTPSRLAERIISDREALVGERKLVTVMFADVVGSTAVIESADPEDAAEYLSAALGGMVEAIHSYEGTVNELRGDGLMALFGAPIAHEDHAVRAARAALAIPDSVAMATDGRALTRVGLNSGQVLVRSVDNDLSMEYQAVGPTVHLAARMESLAKPGGTVVTADTYRMIEGHIEANALGPASVKGISAPVEVFELTEAVDTTPWEARATRGLTEFTGREAELSRLRRYAEKARGGQGHAVLIQGEAGVGKSRLVHEFLNGGAVEGFSLLRAEASPFETNTALYPIKGLIEMWLSSTEASDTDETSLRSALQTLNSDPTAALPALAALMDRPVEDPEWEQLSPQQRRSRTRDALMAIIHDLAQRQPLAVLIEDLHWIDFETQGLIDQVITMSPGLPLLLLLTHRPEFRATWRNAPGVDQIGIGPLNEELSMEFLDCLLGNHPSVADLKPQVAVRAEGTPLFLEETVRSLVETGALTGSEGDYVSTWADTPLEIPDSVQAVLAARIDRLEPRDKKVLQVSSVAGGSVPLRLVSQVLERSEEDVELAMSRLQSRGFLYLQIPPPLAEFKFGHALVRDVAYGSVPREQRRATHAQIVRLLETSRPRSVERLAFHATRAELWEEAAHYSLEASDKSIERSAYREASAFLRQASGALEHIPHSRGSVQASIDALMRLRVAETGAEGGLMRMADDLREAARLAESIGDADRQAHVAIHAGYTSNMMGEVADAEAEAQLAYDLAKSTGDHYVKAESRLLLAQTHMYAGRPASVGPLLAPHTDYLTREIRHETMDQTLIRAVVACSHLAAAAAAQGDFDESLRWENEGISIADEANRPLDRMYMQFAVGKCREFQGEFDQSLRAQERSAEIADANDGWFLMTYVQPWRAHALFRLGRVDEAMDLFEATEESATRVELPFVQAECRAFRSQATAAHGDRAGARQEAEMVLDYARSHDTPLLELLALLALGSPLEAAELGDSVGLFTWAREIRETGQLGSRET